MTRLEKLTSRLDLYFAAEEAILSGAQSYKIGSRELTRGDLQEVSSTIKYLEKEIANETSKASGGGRMKVFGVIPRDF